MKRIKINFRSVFVIIFLFVVAFYVIRMLANATYSKRVVPYFGSNIENQEYRGLFTDSAQKNLQFIISYYSNVKCPKSEYRYDNKYIFLIYKIPLQHNKKESLDSLIKELTSGTVNPPSPFSNNYGIERYSHFDFLNCDDSVPEVNKIVIKFSGKNLFKSTGIDSNLIVYSVLLNAFSIRYDNLKTDDLIINSKDGLSKFQFIFKKANEHLYLIIITRSDRADFNWDFSTLLNKT